LLSGFVTAALPAFKIVISVPRPRERLYFRGIRMVGKAMNGHNNADTLNLGPWAAGAARRVCSACPHRETSLIDRRQDTQRVRLVFGTDNLRPSKRV
jgi:hypothetical protein